MAGMHRALIDASWAHYRRTRQEFQRLDLSPGQPKVLSYLFSNEGSPQKDLAEWCRVEPATMTVLLRSMEQKGLITKQPVHVSGGKRAFSVYLTEHGKEMAQLSRKIMEDIDELALRGFTEQEKEKLSELLNRAMSNMMEQ